MLMEDFWDPCPLLPCGLCQGPWEFFFVPLLPLFTARHLPVARHCGYEGLRSIQGASVTVPDLKGLDATSDEVRNHAHDGSFLWVLRQEPWDRPSLFQVLHDGQLFRGNIETGRGRGLGIPGPEGRGQQILFLPLPRPLQLEHYKGPLGTLLDLGLHMLNLPLSFPRPYI